VMTPIRPIGRDLSIKNLDDTYPLRWYPLSTIPHTASQTEKDAMEWHLFAMTVEALRLLEHACPSTFRFATSASGLAAITTRLSAVSPYEGALVKGSGAVWEVPAKGRHYVIERSVLDKLRAECLKKTAPIAPLASRPDLRDLLNLSPDCKGPAAFTLADVKGLRVDSVREDAFVLTSKVTQRPLTSDQAALLRATHEAHHAVSAWRKDPIHVPQPPLGIVQRAHDQFEASAQDEGQLHFFQIKPFSGVEHPGWAREELGAWAAIQDTYHHRWMEFMLAGNWGRVRESDTAHLFAHLCMNVGPASPWLFVFPWSAAKLPPRLALPDLQQRLGLG
jgi:hypothetical protein